MLAVCYYSDLFNTIKRTNEHNEQIQVAILHKLSVLNVTYQNIQNLNFFIITTNAFYSEKVY